MALRRDRRAEAEELCYTFGTVRVYIDDVERIYEMVNQAASKKREEAFGEFSGPAEHQVTDEIAESDSEALQGEIREAMSAISDDMYSTEIRVGGDWVAEQSEDLRDASSSELLDVKIICFNPSVWIHLARSGAFVRASNPDDQTKALAGDIAAFVRRRRSLPLDSRALLLYSGIVALLAWVYATVRVEWLGDMTVPLMGLMLAAFIIYHWIRNGRAVIVPRRHDEARLFTAETKRNLAIAMATSVITAVVTVLVTLALTA